MKEKISGMILITVASIVVLVCSFTLLWRHTLLPIEDVLVNMFIIYAVAAMLYKMIVTMREVRYERERQHWRHLAERRRQQEKRELEAKYGPIFGERLPGTNLYECLDPDRMQQIDLIEYKKQEAVHG
ncbi:MAG: hypothetical protein Q4B26_03800 [Eubacteriales bacterium]|nr:hypothetical protein [Eubacteriales bacterium]